MHLTTGGDSLNNLEGQQGISQHPPVRSLWGYFPFFFSCLAFFFSLAVLVGFFLVSFLVSIDLAMGILLLLGFSISFFELNLSQPGWQVNPRSKIKTGFDTNERRKSPKNAK